MTALRFGFPVALLAALTAACAPATNHTYEGEPLATLRGTMTAQEELVLTHPVRLALAWFSNFPQAGVPSAPPRSVVTDEVTYTGTFPQAYTLALTSLPPQDAITVDANGVRGAVGVLLAYEDLNGDGELTVSTGGPVVDRVLGASASGLVNLLEPGVRAQGYLIYVESLPPDAPAGATTGYNLVSTVFVDGGVTQTWRSLSTASLALELTAAPLLNLLACSDFYARLASPSVGAGACGITSGAGAPLPVTASLYVSGSTASAFITLGGLDADGGFEVIPGAADAGVTVNGQPLTWNGTAFFLFEATRAVILDGPNVVRVAMPGRAVWAETGVVPPAFSVTAPMRVQTGATFDVSWVRAAGDASLFNAISGAQFPMVANDRAQFVAPDAPASMFITVQAMNPVFPSPKVRCSRSETVTVTVETP